MAVRRLAPDSFPDSSPSWADWIAVVVAVGWLFSHVGVVSRVSVPVVVGSGLGTVTTVRAASTVLSDTRVGAVLFGLSLLFAVAVRQFRVVGPRVTASVATGIMLAVVVGVSLRAGVSRRSN
ncbi:MAG: hypothetical protein ABEI75_01165 [Halobaculum sp.]